MKKQGYDVRADGVRGYLRPLPVGGKDRVPNIVASKGTRTRIIEIETPQSVLSDREQHKVFVRHAAQKKNTTFEIVVTIPRKSKITS